LGAGDLSTLLHLSTSSLFHLFLLLSLSLSLSLSLTLSLPPSFPTEQLSFSDNGNCDREDIQPQLTRRVDQVLSGSLSVPRKETWRLVVKAGAGWSDLFLKGGGNWANYTMLMRQLIARLERCSGAEPPSAEDAESACNALMLVRFSSPPHPLSCPI